VSERRKDLIVFFALILGVTTLVGLTADSVGFTRDEGYYFKAGQEYWGWFKALGEGVADGEPTRAFDRGVIDQHLDYNHEHPVLVKFTFALSYGIGHELLGVFPKASTAFRFPAWLFAGLCVALIFALSRALLSRRASLLAALMFLSMPRAFWHMHLACFDIPVCAAHLWLVLAYLKGRATVKGALICGVAFGLAAATKHNVLVTPAFFVLHWILTTAKLPRLHRRGFVLPAVPLAFFAMALVGPVVFVLHWPYLWPDVVKRIGWYLGFHLNHEHYPILWFGDLLTKPPFPVSFPFVMSAVTIPVPVLMALVVGAGLGVYVGARFLWDRARGAEPAERTKVPLGAREPSGSVALLLLLNAAFPFALIALPSSPIFGGTKHWMNALPFLCVLGAWAIEEGVTRLGLDEKLRRIVFVALAVLILLPGAWLSARVHPYGLSSYNAIAGFARGAANIGFQRTFWGHEPRLALDGINARARKNARIAFGDTNHDDYRFYRRDKMLRKDLRWSGVSGADVASVQPQGEFKDQWMLVKKSWGVRGPDHVVHVEGVPLVTVTHRPGRSK
jgi:4-amino-4-deoxy-L-arabinose transferase-like glycosyltransferase